MISNNMLILKGCLDHFIFGMDFLENLGTTLTFGRNTTPLRIATRLGMVTTVESELVDMPGNITPAKTTKRSTFKVPARPRLKTPEPPRSEPIQSEPVCLRPQQARLPRLDEYQPVTTLNRLTIDNATWPSNKMKDVRKNPQSFPEYVVKKDCLYRNFPSSSLDIYRAPRKLCVPKEQRMQVLQEAQDAHTAGHQGIHKTIRRITNHYYWPGMFRDISKYVRACQVCQRFKVSQQPPAGLMLTHLPEEPWATVCADFVGPLPRSKHGHTTLLVLQDKSTKWIELVRLRSATSDGAIKGIRSTIISRFGTPKMLITDNGTQFVSAVFRRALDNWGIKHQLTAPYTPQENAVERANRVVKTMIAQFCEQNQRTWDEPLPEITLALNTSVSESTGFSPGFLLQGREPRLPRALFDQLTPGTGNVPESSQDMSTRLQEVFHIVQQLHKHKKGIITYVIVTGNLTSAS